MKRGQATTFVILGLVIASIVITGIYFREEIFSNLGKKPLSEQPLSTQIGKVQSYAQSCLSETLEEGVTELGMRGGHLSPIEGEFQATAYNPLSSELSIFGDAGLKISYWHFLTPNNIERTYVPTIESMEVELRGYTKENLENCLNDFSVFITEGYTIDYNEPRISVDIGDKTVLASAEMNLQVTFKETTQTFKSFNAEIDVPLGKMYKNALEIYNYEIQTGFVENFSLENMIVYDNIPFSGVDFDCTPRTWLKSQVIQDLKSIFALNIPLLKIQGTDFRLNDKRNEQLIHDALSGSEKDLTVSMVYSPDWPMMVDVIGTNSEVLRGRPFTTENEAAKFLLPLFCLNDYHFVYDIKYPVLVTLTENDFTFQFPFVAIIDNNQARKNQVQVPIFDDDVNICGRTGPTIKVTAQGLTTSGTTSPLGDAEISLSCVFSECSIGKTRLENGVYSLTTQFPECIGGEITATKQGYHPGSIETNTNEDALINIPLEPYYDLPVKIIVEDEGSLRSPYDTESILFQFENKDQDYFTSYYYPSEEPLRLIAGDYIITSTVLVETEGGFNFPSRNVEVCSDAPKRGLAGLIGLTEKKCTIQELDAMELESVVAGGSSISWSVDRRALSTSGEITLYAYRGKTPSTMEELTNSYNDQAENSKKTRKPTFE